MRLLWIFRILNSNQQVFLYNISTPYYSSSNNGEKNFERMALLTLCQVKLKIDVIVDFDVLSIVSIDYVSYGTKSKTREFIRLLKY